MQSAWVQEDDTVREAEEANTGLVGVKRRWEATNVQCAWYWGESVGVPRREPQEEEDVADHGCRDSV